MPQTKKDQSAEIWERIAALEGKRANGAGQTNAEIHSRVNSLVNELYGVTSHEVAEMSELIEPVL